jgi:hypothetical protein
VDFELLADQLGCEIVFELLLVIHFCFKMAVDNFQLIQHEFSTLD